MGSRGTVCVAIAALTLVASTSVATAGTDAAPEALLVSSGALDALGVTAGEGVERVLPARPECSAIARAASAAEDAIDTTVARRSTDRRGRIVLDEVVRVFDSSGAARSFVQPFRDEDPAEECVEAVLAELVAERGVVLDTFADDRTVALGGAPGVAYLAEATYADGAREATVRAEHIIGRSGATVVDVFVIAPERNFVEVATRVERDLAARLRSARQ